MSAEPTAKQSDSTEAQPVKVMDKDELARLYEENDFWEVNTGGSTLHAKRMGGRFRNFKYLTSSVWLVLFIGPWLQWDDRQAMLFDIPARQFHIFGMTFLPQDIWMFTFVMGFFAVLLAVSTAVAGRVFCGFFCFQTVWTDVYTWIEEKLEGSHIQRRKLEKAPWNASKIRKKVIKHVLWLAIAVLTGYSFAAWFTDARDLLSRMLDFTAHPISYGIVGAFTIGTYLLAGFMREQVCFWLCPYARIQGVMMDDNSIVPSYDYKRGEPRGKLKKNSAGNDKGDCIDCGQCVAVCPTGVDIRKGQQEGCITCALCIDACDQIMDKIDKPRGLIRYASDNEIARDQKTKLIRPRVLMYATTILLFVAYLAYGLVTRTNLELNVVHDRTPMFVMQSNGDIQNKYIIKIINKTTDVLPIEVKLKGLEGAEVTLDPAVIEAQPSVVTPVRVFVRVPRGQLKSNLQDITFKVFPKGLPEQAASHDSIFAGPR